MDFLPEEHIHPAVVFTGDAEFKTSIPSGVFNIGNLPAYINQFKEPVMSENRMQFCVGRLETIRRQITKRTDTEHVAYVLKKHAGGK